LTIREAKFDRPRLVPVHPSVSTALQAYASCRDQLCPKPSSETFFITADGAKVTGANTRYIYNKITTSIGMRTTTVRPRIHDLRHSFAVRTRSGIDVSGRMAVLSTYLGHINPAGTYWYLSATPELMGLAAARLDNRFGGGR
jgi:integrase/recombinase XerD